MIVRQFINWVRTAPAGERADATRALCRAWLFSDLSEDDRAAAEGALLMLLDDISPLVRQAMAEVFARSDEAPVAIVRALSLDQPSVAVAVLEYSPLLIDADLVDVVATGGVEVQCAVARRFELSAPVCAAIAEVGHAAAVQDLIGNVLAQLPQFSLDRIIARHGAYGPIREALLARDDLPAASRMALVSQLSNTLTQFVTARQWVGAEHARRISVAAQERAAVGIAASSDDDDLDGLIGHLRGSGQLTPALLLRAVLSGNLDLFCEAMTQLSGLPSSRIESLLEEGGSAAFDALLRRAGLPASTFPAFMAALEVGFQMGFVASADGVARLRRRMVTHVLEHCETAPDASASLLLMLRRFATEAAREEARLFCDELVAGDEWVRHHDGRIAA